MLTLSELFLPPESELASSIVSALDEQGVALSGGGGPSFSAATWRLMAGSLAKRLPGLLDIGVTEVFVGAWNKWLDVRQQIDKSVKSPGKDVFLQLAEHTIKSAHQPYVALMKNGREIGRLSFGTDIELGLQGVVLRILDGTIREIQTARVKGKGTVKCGGALLVRKELQPQQFAGTWQVPSAPQVRSLFGSGGDRPAAAEPAADVVINLVTPMPSSAVRPN
ncbi:MAG: hypothetical protein ABIX28_24740 [Vicinamibacterales bacterium]